MPVERGGAERAALEPERGDAEDAGGGREDDAHPDGFIAADVIDGEVDDARRPAAVAEGGDLQRIALAPPPAEQPCVSVLLARTRPSGRRVVEVQVEVGRARRRRACRRTARPTGARHGRRSAAGTEIAVYGRPAPKSWRSTPVGGFDWSSTRIAVAIHLIDAGVAGIGGGGEEDRAVGGDAYRRPGR